MRISYNNHTECISQILNDLKSVLSNLSSKAWNVSLIPYDAALYACSQYKHHAPSALKARQETRDVILDLLRLSFL